MRGKRRKVKTCILITHQLSIAKRADKIAMVEDGVRTAARMRGLGKVRFE